MQWCISQRVFRLVNKTSSRFFQSSRESPSYLGLTLGAPSKSMVAWDGVEREIFVGRWGSWWKPHLVRWVLVCLDRKGFGVKWKVWRNKGLVLKGRGGYGVGLWKAIRREWDVVSCRLSFVVGIRGAWVKDVSFIEGGNRVLWIETKCGKFSVKSLYKALESSPSASFPSIVIGIHVCSHGEGVGARISLDPSMIGRWMRRIWDVEDRVLWIETKCGKFSVKSLSKALESSPSTSFPSIVI
ncbi:hypothetical protein AAG906_025102 [Vitis piasezkii]